MTDPLTLFIGAILVIGCVAFVLFIVSLIFAERPAQEPMEFEEPPRVYTRIWDGLDVTTNEREDA